MANGNDIHPDAEAELRTLAMDGQHGKGVGKCLRLMHVWCNEGFPPDAESTDEEIEWRLPRVDRSPLLGVILEREDVVFWTSVGGATSTLLAVGTFMEERSNEAVFQRAVARM